MSAMLAEPPAERLEGVRRLTLRLWKSDDPRVWEIANAIDQLCMGTITVAQAVAQVGD